MYQLKSYQSRPLMYGRHSSEPAFDEFEKGFFMKGKRAKFEAAQRGVLEAG
jgi:hypothetical protein